MSTQTKPPLAEQPIGDPHDEYTGAFGFFRRYQKLILYSAGIFALVTFSVTGAMQQFFGGLWHGKSGPLPKIVVNGEPHEILPEDTMIGSALARHMPALPRVIPQLEGGPATSDLASSLAILRRASIAAGLDVSMEEVDRAIGTQTSMINEAQKQTMTPTQVARMRGFDSLGQYRQMVKEAMRIGNYVCLNSIGVDTSDARLIEQLLEDQEKITLRYAMFDRKALEEQLKQQNPATEEAMRTWLDAQPEAEKFRLQVFDTNHVSLVLGVAWYDRFDPKQWETELASFSLGDEQKRQLYEQEKEARFKNEDPAGGFKPLEDEAVQAELLRIAQVDEVLNKLLKTLREEYQKATEAAAAELQKATQEKTQAQLDRDAAKAASEAKPEDEELKQKARLAEETFVAKENAETAGKQAIEAARKGFDFRGRFQELTKDKAGFEVLELQGPKNADALKDLSSIGLGEWKNPYLATSLQNAGELSAAPARTQKGAFLFQASDVVVRPLKPWDQIQKAVEEAYYAEQSKKTGEEKKKALEEALLRLGKEKVADKVAEILAKKEQLVQERFTTWETALQGKQTEAERMLASGLTPGSKSEQQWKAELARVQGELQKREEHRQEIAKAVDAELEKEVAKAARTKYSEVLEAAAQEAGFTVDTIGPVWRQATSLPGFQKRAEKPMAFLLASTASGLKVGETSDVLEDVPNRRYYVATVTNVEPRPPADLTRREFEQMKRFFPLGQLQTAVQQSFDLEALKKRYSYQDPVGRQEETGSAPR